MVDWWSFPTAHHDLHTSARNVTHNNEQPTWARWIFAPIWWASNTERIFILELRHKIYKA